MSEPYYKFEQRRVCTLPQWIPVLLVVIDTEEEFDWSQPFGRNNASVKSMAKVDVAQQIFNEYNISPIYAIDYPIASQQDGFGPLVSIVKSGHCQIGTHVHPWVNPPHTEKVNAVNSYIGNLPRPLVEEKMRTLRSTIEENLGVRPVVFKAGCYGLSRDILEIMVEQGYEVDCSTAPGFDFRSDGGPNFLDSCIDCFWCGPEEKILGIPTTGALTGLWQWKASATHQFCTTGWRKDLHLLSILSRLNVHDQIRLSPEGYTWQEHRKLTRFLLTRGVRTFTFSFHSPSLAPGNTAYVRTESDLQTFLDTFRRYFDYFFGELGGRTMTAFELKKELAKQHAHQRSQVHN